MGGAKLALGLSDVLEDPDRLTVVANTGDDFEHLGLKICPDLDTLTYTLAGLANEETGWGRAGESGAFMAALGALGGETWFFLGDKDLAIHVERTRRLRAGESLSAVTADLCARLGIVARIVPMSDDPVPTVVETADGPLAFQHYFVRRALRAGGAGLSARGRGGRRGPVCGLHRCTGGARSWRRYRLPVEPPTSASTPSLRCRGVRGRARGVPGAGDRGHPPLSAEQAVKGPTAKMMTERGIAPSAAAIARALRRADRRASFSTRPTGPQAERHRRHRRRGRGRAQR